MAISENAISQWSDIFQEVIGAAGAAEHTRIIPNLEVIDDAPTGLTGYIIVRNDQGFYGPVLKLPGFTYSNGDFVNVLFLKGTEPIAISQGSASGGSNAGRVSTVYNSTLVDPVIEIDAAGNVVVNASQVDRDLTINVNGGVGLFLSGASGDLFFGGTIFGRLTDPDTYLGFSTADAIAFLVGGAELLRLIESGQDLVQVNPNQSDMDFEVGYNGGVALFVEGSSGIVSLLSVLARDGDSDTKLTFTDDKIALTAGNVELLALIEAATDEVVVNDAGAVVVFRVEGDTDTALISTDATNDRVGIGTSSPATKLHVSAAVDALLRLTRTGTDQQATLQIVNGNGQNWVIGNTGTAGSFFIRDSTGATTFFVAEATCPNNAFYMRASGNTSIGNGQLPDTSTGSFLQVVGSLGGGRYYEKDGVGSTAVNLVNNGTPDAANIFQATYAIKHSGGTYATGQFTVDSTTTTTNINIGGDTFQLRRNSDGSIDIRRISGSGTIKINGWATYF